MKVVTLELTDRSGDSVWVQIRKHSRGVQIRWRWNPKTDLGVWFGLEMMAEDPGLLRPCIPLIRAALASLKA